MKKLGFSARTLSFFATIALVLLLLPIAITSIYNRPILDDLIQPYPTMVTYQETGSVFRAFITAMQETIRIWNDRSGIFSSMLVSVFAPYTFHYTYGFFHPILLLILMILACFKVVQCLYLINSKIPAAYVCLIATILSIAMLTTMPGILEGLYWYSSAINYTFFFILSLLLFSSLIKTICTNNMTARKTGLLLALYSLGFFILGGANWMTPTYSIVVYCVITIFVFWKKKPIRYLLPFVFLLIGYGLAVAAPGNSARQEVVGTRLGLLEAFVKSFSSIFQFCIENEHYYILVLLLIPVFARLKQYFPPLPKYLLLMPILSICIMAAANFPLVYSNYSIACRHTNIIFFLFTILLFINVALLVIGITQWFPSLVHKREHFSVPLTCIWVSIVTVFLLHSHHTTIQLSPVDIDSYYIPIKSAIHLMQGYSKNYANSYDHLVYTLQNTDEGVIIVEPSLKSPILGTPDFQLDPNMWINKSFVTYYTNNDILLTQPQEAN